MDKNTERLYKEIHLLEKPSQIYRPFGGKILKEIKEENSFSPKEDDIGNYLGQYHLPQISPDTYKELEKLIGIGDNLLPNYTKNHNKNIDNIIERLEENLENNTSINEKSKEYKKSIIDFGIRRYKY